MGRYVGFRGPTKMQPSFREERRAWRATLLNGFLWCTTVAALLAAGFLAPGWLLGWATLPFVAVTLLLLLASAVEKLGFVFRTVVLLGGLYSASILALIANGVSPNALVGLSASSAVATLLLGRRWGIATLLVATVSICAVVALTRAGLLVRSPEWWRVYDSAELHVAFRVTIVFVAASSIIVFGTSHLLGRTERLLEQNEQSLHALQREVAEREALERTLERERAAFRRAEELELLGRLAAFAAHDFNNALLVIRGACDMIRTPTSASEIDEGVNLIEQAISQATETSAQLRSLGRKGSDRKTRLDANEQLVRLTRMLTHLLPRNITIRFEPGETVHILANEATFQRTLVNLALNARDAMPKGGEITFVLREPDPERQSTVGCAAIDVIDTGHGIPESLLEKIFEPFYSTKGSQGTGLGLASVRELLRAQGGDVLVRSRVERGTTFTVLWPVALDGTAAAR